MNSKHQKTLTAIFSDPIDGNLEWRRIESLFLALGCDLQEKSGSGVTFSKNGINAAFHRPHPQKAALRYRVKIARDFLTDLGVTL